MAVIRGGGDLATGVVWRLHHAGFAVLVCELDAPLAIRRRVALSTAVEEGSVDIEGMRGVRADSSATALDLVGSGVIPVLVSPGLPEVDRWMVVDARMAKINLDTTIADAPLVVGLGPGFVAGSDCHAVVETMRGHRLGRVLWEGGAAANTGVPGEMGGMREERVVRAPIDGVLEWGAAIGDRVRVADRLGRIGTVALLSPIDGVVRGLFATGRTVPAGLKIADIDPRAEVGAAFEISDKALAIGGGVVEAALSWRNR